MFHINDEVIYLNKTYGYYVIGTIVSIDDIRSLYAVKFYNKNGNQYISPFILDMKRKHILKFNFRNIQKINNIIMLAKLEI